MGKLRILEESSRMPKVMDYSERKRILEELRGILTPRSEVALAVVHGGFVESRVFRDIDVAVFTGHRVPVEEEHVYASRLSDELREVTGGAFVDVTVIDNAPPGFVVNALSRCVVLVERVPGLRLHLLIRAAEDHDRLKQWQREN